MNNWRALGESLALHALLLGAVLLLASGVAAPPPLVRLDFCLATPDAPPGGGKAALAEAGPAVQPGPPAPEPVAPPAPSAPAQTVAAVAPPPVKSKPKTAPAPFPQPAAAVAPSLPLPPPDETAPPQAAPSAASSQVETNPAAVAAEAEPHGAMAGLGSGPREAVVAGSGEENPVATGLPGTGAVGAGGAVNEGGQAEEAAAVYRSSHYETIRTAILSRLSYPPSARRQGWSGLVEVSFLVDLGGGVRDLQVRTSSGYPRLDSVVLDAVRRAAPFPPPPVVAQLIMPVRFELN